MLGAKLLHLPLPACFGGCGRVCCCYRRYCRDYDDHCYFYCYDHRLPPPSPPPLLLLVVVVDLGRADLWVASPGRGLERVPPTIATRRVAPACCSEHGGILHGCHCSPPTPMGKN